MANIAYTTDGTNLVTKLDKFYNDNKPGNTVNDRRMILGTDSSNPDSV